MASRLELQGDLSAEEPLKCTPYEALLPTKESFAKMGMEEIIQLTLLEDGKSTSCVVVEINRQATVQNLVSAYCTQRGISSNSQLTVFDIGKKPLSPYETLHSAGITDKQTLCIGPKDQYGFREKKWLLVLAIIVVTVGFIGIFIMSITYHKSGGIIPFDFGVVMDAGSSKTNVILYRWAGDKFKGTGCVKQNDSCLVKGGIAKAPNISYVLPCISNISSKIPDAIVPTTPLYFAATAGMRLLNISSPIKTQTLLTSLETVLNGTGLDLRVIEIINGKDEGLYAWITTNFLKDTLAKEQKSKPWRTNTYGALDMGGASMQIAFAIEPSSQNDTNTQNLRLYGQTHNVLSMSYLCFGRDEAERRHKALLIKNPELDTTIEDPCLPKSFSISKDGSDLFDQPCTHFKNRKISPNVMKKNFKFIGTSDYEKCAVRMQVLMDPEKCQQAGFTQCFNKTHYSWGDQKFAAFSSYFFTTNFLGLLQSTLPQYINTTKDYCHKDYSQISSKGPYAKDYCFNACYIYEVLINSYGFNETTWKDLEFLSEIDEKDLGWTLGYMINATNAIKEKEPSPRFISTGVLAIILIILIAIVIVTTIFIIYNYCAKQRMARGSHQALFRSP